MKIAFIGGGKMGEAIIRAVLKGKISAARDITISDISESRRMHLKKEYGVMVTADNKEAISGKEIVVLAVKPQNISEVLNNLKGSLKPSQLLVSIAAGVKINRIRKETGHRSIVRVMPNTPAQIGLGMSGWTATRDVGTEQKQRAKKIFGAMGKEVYFNSEKYLDMVTAVSGSGPAYMYLFAEALIDGAVGLGIKRKEAEKLVIQTVLGAAEMMGKTDKAPAELRREVASKGGTTERAIKVFEESKLAGIVSKAVKAAYEKAKELGEVKPD